VQSAGRVDVVEGGATDTYQIALQSIPTSNVVITVDPDNQTDLGAGAGVAIMLTFTAANALIPQVVTVTAVVDMTIEGSHLSTISHTAASVDARYNGLVISNVVANITEQAFLAGDYNSNGSVDAADYVLWRKTLGSTTMLAADGSGPSTGVPNGVVDSFDYTFWSANFGASSPGSGSGSGIAGASESLVAAASVAEPPLAVAVPVQLAREPVAVDAAVEDFNFDPATTNGPREPAHRPGARSTVALHRPSTDALLLLLVGSHADSAESRGVSDDAAFSNRGDFASTNEVAEIEALFATATAADFSPIFGARL
jgi:hypothetical protein